MKHIVWLALTILASAPSDATPIGRRGFLKGLSLVTGALTRPPATLVPSVTIVARASAPVQALRAERLHSILSHSEHFKEAWTGSFEQQKIDVIADWCAQMPEQRASILAKLNRLSEMNRRFDEIDIVVSSDIETEVGRARMREFSDLARERDELEDELTEVVVDWPWSTMNWAEVFNGRTARIENDVAAELGVDVGRVYQLTDHALTTLSRNVRTSAHLFTLLAHGELSEPPLYSRRALEVLARHFRAEVPTLARQIEKTNASEDIDPQVVRNWLVKSSRSFELTERSGWPFAFDFEKFDYFRRDKLDAFAMAPDYARAFVHFDRLRGGLETLEESSLKTVALAELNDLERVLAEELRTLPARVDALHEMSGRKLGEDSNGSNKTWAEFAVHAAPLERATLVRWEHLLRSLSVSTHAVAPLADECASLLTEAPATPLLIEAHADESLSLGGIAVEPPSEVEASPPSSNRVLPVPPSL